MTDNLSLFVIARSETTKQSFLWYMKLFKKCLAEFISASKVFSRTNCFAPIKNRVSQWLVFLHQL